MFTLESNRGPVVLVSSRTRLRIAFVTPSIARITLTRDKPFLERPSLIVTCRDTYNHYSLKEDNTSFHISTPELTLVIAKSNGAIRYLDASGRTLLTELGKTLTPRKLTRNVFRKDATIAGGQSIDGARVTVEEYETVFDRDAFGAKLEWLPAENEALFGLGSHEEGHGNLRGKSRELYQQNMKMVVPHIVSTRGYSILLDCCSLMTFRDDESGSCWWADAVDELDYYFIRGNSFDEVIRNYHILTGPVPMLPKWAFGFVQSKERYVNSEELLEVVREHRRRKIPLDMIVLDWKSWPNGSGWGQKSFDPARFPDPAALTDQLHDLGVKLMVSIWPIMTNGCPDQLEMLERGKMLGNQSTYDAFDTEARAVYWEQVNRGLFSHGVDAWWCDCTEPFEADWSGAEKPEPAERLRINTEASSKYLDPTLINAYSLLHSHGIYEGQRASAPDKRVLNLTRSSYAGQHRYGTVSWNGDICATWETLRRCIPEGLNFCATGEPWWTLDIGGFFINHDPEYWFWRGDFPEGCRGLTGMEAMEPDPADTGCKDLGFHELYTRWLQYAVFLPMFRSHGTDAAREIWRFGDEGYPFYDAIAESIRQRYRLLPHIYSLASDVSRKSRMMLRAVALDFPDDPATHAIDDQFLFGPSLLVCPVTQPMFYGPGSEPLNGVDPSRNVYLPRGCDWYDFRNGEKHPGGQTIIAAAPLDSIPVFVREGTILPLGPVIQYALETTTDALEIRVYPGADATYTLYEDSGEDNGFEQGEFSLILFHWDELNQQLTIESTKGTFPGMEVKRKLKVVLMTNPLIMNEVVYDGKTKNVSFSGRNLAKDHPKFPPAVSLGVLAD